MRRVLIVLAIAAAAVAVPVMAQPGECGTPDAPCWRAYLPRVSRDPTPTRTPTRTPLPPPTATPEPAAVCQEVIQDGGFEKGADGPWRKVGNGIAAVVDRTRGFHDPVDGRLMAFLEGDPDDLVIMSNGPFAGNWKGFKSATLTYSWWGIANDPDDFADSLGVALADLDDPTDGGLMMQKFHWNQDTPFKWTTTSIDVSDPFRRNHKNLWLWMGSGNDILIDAFWTVDAVSLIVCSTGGPETIAPSAPDFAGMLNRWPGQ